MMAGSSPMSAHDGYARRLALPWLALFLGVLFWLRPASYLAGQFAEAQQDLEFRRHLRQGIEQMRSYLMDSAAAEFAACARMRPEDPELLFHLARLRLYNPKSTSDLTAALEILHKALAAKPASMKMRRLAFEIEMAMSHFGAAFAHQKAIEASYGQLGAVENDAYLRVIQQRDSGELDMPLFDPAAPCAADYAELGRAMQQLLREGEYAPSQAVPVLERLLQKHPDLLMVRIQYVRRLIFEQVRVNFSDRPDVPLMSSRLIFGYAEAHLGKIFDMVAPSSAIAVQSAIWRVALSLKMGDFDQTVSLTDAILSWPAVPLDYRRTLTAQKGLARLRQKRYAEAIELLESSLEGSDRVNALLMTSMPRPISRKTDIFESGTMLTPDDLSNLWLLHVAYEAAGTPRAKRVREFPFRKDLPMKGYATPMLFEDIAPKLGIDKLNGLGPCAWADFDRDGDYDLYSGGMETFGTLFRNDGSRFSDATRAAGLFHAQSGFSSTFADYDTDGWRDLYIGRDGWNGPAPNSLYRNNGNGTFTDVTHKAGVGHPGATFLHCWLDYDRDGRLDLYLCNGITGSGDTNTLYRNNGDGTFTDVTARAGLQEAKGIKTIAAAVGDYDRDGWPDIFVSGYMHANRLYHNRRDGTFREVAKAAGVDGSDHISTGYTSFFMDYNNDGYPDILPTSLAPWPDTQLFLSSYWSLAPAHFQKAIRDNSPRLYRNNGNGTFTDVSEEAGLVFPLGTMGAGVADLDNDGYLDIYFATGDPKLERLEPDRFLHNNGDGTFTDLTFAVGLGNIGKGHGITFIDWDGDGDLEIYAQEGGGRSWRSLAQRLLPQPADDAQSLAPRRTGGRQEQPGRSQHGAAAEGRRHDAHARGPGQRGFRLHQRPNGLLRPGEGFENRAPRGTLAERGRAGLRRRSRRPENLHP
jgi:tetratricopeptide (TPR) repeat protein